MTKFMGLVVVLAATTGATLVAPGTSQAGWLFRRGCCDDSCCYSYPVANCCQNNCGCCQANTGCCQNRTGCCTQVATGCCNTGSAVSTPSYSTTYYYPSYGSYYSGNYSSGRSGLFSGYYRVGNVIINGRRWGDIGYRYSHSDLIRW
jgi:hypothetical protein